MSEFTDKLKAIEDDLKKVKEITEQLVQLTKNISGSPLIQAFAGMKLDLNKSLNVVSLENKISTDIAAAIAAHVAEKHS